MTKIQKLQLDLTKINTLNKDELVKAVQNYGGTVKSTATKAELVLQLVVIITNEIAKIEIADNAGTDMTSADIEKEATKILTQAKELHEAFADMTVEERQAYIENELTAPLAEYFKSLFPKFGSEREYRKAIATADDAPTSAIIAGLPVRVVEQSVESFVADYNLGNLISMEMVRNGLKELFFNDFNDADSKSGYSDVEIADYNPKGSPVSQKLYQVDTDLHATYPILDKVLNESFLSPALFVSVINSYLWGIAKPIAKALYKRFLTLISDPTQYDFSQAFSADDAKVKAKAVKTKITSLQTVSRNHLKAKLGGTSASPLGLEYRLKPSNAILIVNAKYQSDYQFDLSANTFNLGEIVLQVAGIQVVDFALLKEFGFEATFADSAEVIVFENGVYKEFTHYDASKVVDTPKLKQVFHRYLRVGNQKLPHKLLGVWTKFVAPAGK